MDQYKCFWRASLDLISNTLILNHLHRNIKSCVCTATCLFVYLSQKTITCKMIWYLWFAMQDCWLHTQTHRYTQTDRHTHAANNQWRFNTLSAAYRLTLFTSPKPIRLSASLIRLKAIPLYAGDCVAPCVCPLERFRRIDSGPRGQINRALSIS